MERRKAGPWQPRPDRTVREGGRAAAARLALAALLLAGPAAAAVGDPPPRYLSGPSGADPLDAARAHLAARRAELGLEPDDLERAELVHRRHNRRSGTHHFFFRQRLRGLDVIGADLGLSLDTSGRVLSRWSRAVRGLARAAPPPRPGIAAAQAVVAAATHLGRSLPGAPLPLGPASDPERRMLFSEPAASLDPIPVRLAYLARPQGEVALIWDVVLRTPDGAHWGNVFVDAIGGAVLETHDWVRHDSYRVFPPPVEDPEDGARALVASPADPLASPFGWHDTNGAAGPEFTDTRGNNVQAQEDVDGNDAGGTRPSSPTLDFEFALDLSQPPSSYQPAAITNLFFWNNLAHDLFYHYGFDEAAGNFQTHNYGRGGLGGDAVRADAQDGSGTNNATFATPPDGTAPRMQMFVWNTALGPRVSVHAPAAIAGPRPAGDADFGPALDAVGLTGDVVRALDPADLAGPSTADACSPLTNPGEVAGNVALVDRGDCTFAAKVKNCQDAGASAVIVANNAGDALVTMSGSDPTVTIPSLFVGQTDGGEIASELGSGVSATLQVLIERDSDLDAGVIVHEYGHGVTNRLTGGPTNALCLDEDRGRSLGEGWSDFFALAFLARPGDAPAAPRAIAAYLAGDPRGIRGFAYSTDPGTNPLHFADVETRLVPHGVGEVWAVTLWEAYWELVEAYGFDPDLRPGSAGNQRALGLVIDALSLQPCDPDFLEARDALLQADLAASGGDDACLLWDAFARRGLGTGATDTGSGAIDVSEDYSVPQSCEAYCGDGVLQSPESCDDGNRIDFDGCHSVCLGEDTFTLEGTAQGGSVSLSIEGVEVTVSTSAGQSAEQVLVALADAIDADPTLSAQGISAQVADGVLTTGGTISETTIDDAGFAPAVPALSTWTRLLAVLMLALAAPLALNRGASPRSSRSSSRTCPRSGRWPRPR